MLLRAVNVDKANSEWAVEECFEQYARELDRLPSEYLRGRSADVRDVKNRVLRLLLDGEASGLDELTTPSIVLARDLAPSDTASLDPHLVLGFCTSEGGPTSHTAILARSLGIPAVVGTGAVVMDIPSGAMLALDGFAGELIVAPGASDLHHWGERRQAWASLMETANRTALEPALTLDGRRVKVMGNVGDIRGARTAVEGGAEGIGLLRTEFLFLGRNELPTEEEQVSAYREILMALEGGPVTLRTLDIGGDKPLPFLNPSTEANPFLGVRGARLSLARPEQLRVQLRAALRAGVGHTLKVMFPMISTVEELDRLLAILNSCSSELAADGLDQSERPEVGIMVEVPSAALIADHLAARVDFFSIGTNDLSQYTLAADRTNPSVAAMANGLQPAVLKLVDMVIQAGHARGKWVGLCGELAGDPIAIPILLGLGLDEFSMSPPAIAVAKHVVRSLDTRHLGRLAHRALGLSSPAQVADLVRTDIPAVAMFRAASGPEEVDWPT
jgi:phosphoenolpyruvate-protein phosphotransferase